MNWSFMNSELRMRSNQTLFELKQYLFQKHGAMINLKVLIENTLEVWIIDWFKISGVSKCFLRGNWINGRFLFIRRLWFALLFFYKIYWKVIGKF